MADKTVNVQLNLKVNAGELKAVSAQLSEAGKAADEAAKKTEGAAKSMKSFVSAAAVIMIARKAVKELGDALKQTEEGAAALKGLSEAGRDVQVAFASGIMPAVKDFSDFMLSNLPTITKAAEMLGKSFNVMGEVIAVAIAGIAAGIKMVLLGPLSLIFTAIGMGMEKLKIAGADTMKAIGSDMAGSIEVSFKTMDAAIGSTMDAVKEHPKELTKVMSAEEKKRLEDQKRMAKESLKQRQSDAKMAAGVLDAALKAEQDAFVEDLQARQENEKSAAEFMSGIQQQLTDDRIARMKDGLDKELEEKQASYEKDLEAYVESEDFKRLSEEKQLALMEELARNHLANLQSIRDEAEVTRSEKASEDAKKAAEEQARAREQQIQNIVDIAQAVQTVASQVNQLISNITALQVQDIKEAADAEKAHAKATIKDQKALQKELDRIDADAAKKEKEAREKEKASAIVMSIINGAVAIVKGYADYGPILGTVLAVVTAAVTATQIALIASQSFAKGGVVQGASDTGDRNMIRANAGEMVLTRTQQARLFDIAEGRSSAMAASISVGGDTIIIQGNADESAIAAIRETKQEQLTRMREMQMELAYRGQAA